VDRCVLAMVNEAARALVIWTAIRGVRTAGPMAPEIAMDRQRPAQFVFSRHVQDMMSGIHAAKPGSAKIGSAKAGLDKPTVAAEAPQPKVTAAAR